MWPVSSARLFRFVLRPVRIRWPSFRTVRWPPSRRAVTLASITAQVSPDTQARLTCPRKGGLGIWVLNSEKSLTGANKRLQRRSQRGKRSALRR